MELEIISPGGVLFKGETDYVSFPGTAGSFDVLPHHAPMIAALEEGVIRYQTDEKKEQEIKNTERIRRDKRRYPVRMHRIKKYDHER